MTPEEATAVRDADRLDALARKYTRKYLEQAQWLSEQTGEIAVPALYETLKVLTELTRQRIEV